MDRLQIEREIAESKLNPTNIKNQLQDLVDGVEGGWISGVEAKAAIKLFSKSLEDANKKLNEAAIEELRSYPNGYENNFCKVELRNSAKRYSFKHIPEWSEKKAELQDIEATAKGALVGYEKGLDMVTADGEIIQPAKVSGGGESVVITLKK